MSETTTEWRECDDPEVLAAAVAAGVEVQCVTFDGRTWETGCEDSAAFRRCMANNCRYRLPADWSPTPEPPADDMRERIARAAAGGYMRVPTDALDGMYLGPPWLDVADAVLAVLPTPPDVAMHDGEPVEQWRWDAVVAERDWLAARLDEADAERTKLRHKLVESAPPVPPSGDENDNIARLTEDQGDRIVNACCRMLSCEPADIDGDAAYEEILTEAVERCADLHGQDRWEDDCHGCGFRVGDHTTDGRCPPVPPWPGAVLSGLTDEDGVPTWLAQAGQVRGERVRLMVGSEMWMTCSRGWSAIRWVEVRAPRPEPETERVPWWKALGRTEPGGETIRKVGAPYARTKDGKPVPVVRLDDGTPGFEVLKDGQ